MRAHRRGHSGDLGQRPRGVQSAFTISRERAARFQDTGLAAKTFESLRRVESLAARITEFNK